MRDVLRHSDTQVVGQRLRTFDPLTVALRTKRHAALSKDRR